MDLTTNILFGRVPREFAVPQRFVVKSFSHFEKSIEQNNGIKDCFVSVYPSNFLIDKLFFDIEYGPTPLQDTKDMFSWMKNRSYDVIPIASGNPKRPGYHLHLKLQPKLYGPLTKLLLTKAGYSIIQSVFGDFIQESTIIENKKVRILRDSNRILGPDPTCIGDIRRLCRVPNTLRPPSNKTWCTFLDPDKFLSMTQSDVYEHIRHQHNYDYDINNGHGPLLTDFDFDLDLLEVISEKWEPLIPSSKFDTLPSNPCLFLEGLLRPCLYKNIIKIHPTDDVRFATTVDLLQHGYSPEFITHVYSTLGWEDFEETKTLKKIQGFDAKVKSGEYTKCSCTKLREWKIPRICCIG